MKKAFIKEELQSIVVLDKELTHHIVRVLRYQKGDTLLLNDALGQSGRYELIDIHEGVSNWQLLDEIVKEDIERSPLVLVQSFLKGDKFEWILQKVTELHVTEIVGVSTKYSVASYDVKKLQHKKERWEKIITEAAQQSGRTHLPQCMVYDSLSLAIDTLLVKYPKALLLVAYEKEDKVTLKEILERENPFGSIDVRGIIFCIGPEGGFAESEIKALEEKGCVCVSLGKSILRAETAAISTAAILQYERGY